MAKITDEIFLNIEVTLVDRADERQLVHIFQYFAGCVVVDRPLMIAVGKASDRTPITILRDVPDREVELVAGDEIDGW